MKGWGFARGRGTAARLGLFGKAKEIAKAIAEGSRKTAIKEITDEKVPDGKREFN